MIKEIYTEDLSFFFLIFFPFQLNFVTRFSFGVHRFQFSSPSPILRDLSPFFPFSLLRELGPSSLFPRPLFSLPPRPRISTFFRDVIASHRAAIFSSLSLRVNLPIEISVGHIHTQHTAVNGPPTDGE